MFCAWGMSRFEVWGMFAMFEEFSAEQRRSGSILNNELLSIILTWVAAEPEVLPLNGNIF